MNRLGRNDFQSKLQADDEDTLYETQALIHDKDDFCDDETNHFDKTQLAMRHRQLLDRDETSFINNNEYELKGFKTPRDVVNDLQVDFTYYDIQPGDSLQSICLRYACPISQVKRMNGLMIDQDFYGLRRLKLPLGKLGLLEDVIKQQQNGSKNLLSLEDSEVTQSRQKIVNSPGSALSVTNKHKHPRFKPLLSPGYSSDRINDLNRPNEFLGEQSSDIDRQTNLHHNSNSFTSLREFDKGDTGLYVNRQGLNKATIPKQNFIKSEIIPDPSQITIDNLLIDEGPIAQNIFEDLDFHVERARVAAGGYEKRATELVEGINITTSVGPNGYTTTKASKIPELFFSGENFGLNLKRIIILIFFVCLVIPLVYMTDVIK